MTICPAAVGESGRTAGPRVLLATPLVLLALAAPVHAEPLFAAPFYCFTTGGDPSAIAVADLNADGQPDVVTANAYSNTVSVLLGSGDQAFGAQTDFATGSVPRSVAIADLNGDGRPDLAVSNAGSYDHGYPGTVSVLLGNGDGTFRPRTDFDVGLEPSSVAIADLDGDARPDIVVANVGNWDSGEPGSVSVLPGSGDGTFRARTDFRVGGNPRSLAIADLNADGRPDVAVANQGYNTVSVLLGNGDGSLGGETGFHSGDDPVAVAVADLDGDGQPDLAVANLWSHTVSVLPGNGDGTFAVATEYGTGNFPSSVAIADLNGDAVPDLAVTSQAAIAVLLGRGDGSFEVRTDFATGARPRALAIADLNADGQPDMAVASGGQNQIGMVSVSFGNGDGTFGPRTEFGVGTVPLSVAVADLNRDGRPDIAAANSRPNTVSVLLGNGDGTFAAKTDFGTGSFPASVAIADLNADGRPDLAVANAGSSTVSVLLGNGDGTFRTPTDFGTRTSPRSVAIADLNSDERPDLAAACLESGAVSVLLGTGDGTFGAGTDFAAGSSSLAVAVADLNGDARPDLAVTNLFDSGTVSVLLGNGDGTFATRTAYGTGSNPQWVAIADLNDDGRPDLAVTDRISPTVSVLLGIGDGTFGAKTDFLAADGPRGVAITDLNGDGRPDLAVACTGSNTVTVLFGSGDGTFPSKAHFGAGRGGPYSVAIGDVNLDGRPDLAVANSNSNTVSVLVNRSAPAPPRAIAFDFTPGTLNLASRGRWVTGLLEPGPPLAAGDIDVASIRLNGTVPVDPAAPTALGDHNGNGVPDLMVKFDRTAVELTVSEGDSVAVTVTGTLGSESFSGTDHIRVRRGRILAPPAGSHLTAGSVAQVRWETPNGVTVGSVALLYSPEGGSNWSLVTRGQPNIGSCDWTVPNLPTDQAKVAVLVESADGSGAIEGVLGVSEAFAIGAAVAVGDPAPAQFALAIRGVTPNPAVGNRLRVEFALRDGSPARLELLDVAGRALASKQVGSLGPGRHSLDLSDGRGIPPGVYFLHLTQAGTRVRARIVVLR